MSFVVNAYSTVITDKGNVGIGTSNPSTLLHIVANSANAALVISQVGAGVALNVVGGDVMFTGNVFAMGIVNAPAGIVSGGSSNVFWHAGNDGSGSGLDADLLDGNNSNFFTNATNMTTGTVPNARLAGVYGGITDVGTLVDLDVSGNVTIDTTTLTIDTVGDKVGIGTAAPSSPLHVVGAANITGAIVSAGAASLGQLSTGLTTITGNVAVDTNVLSIDVNANRIGINKTVPTTDLDLAGSMNVSGNVYVTGTLYAPNLGAGGNTVWHAGNDGTGSGLDADLLDGNDSVFYTNTTNHLIGTTPSGRLTGAYAGITAVGTLTSAVVSGNVSVDTNVLHVDSVGNKIGVNKLQPNNTVDIVGGINATSDIASSTAFKVGANTAMHQGNDGSGSGYDADLLDGQEGSFYVTYTNLQAKPNIIDALDSISISGNTIAYFTSVNAAANTVLTEFARTLIAATTDSAARAVLGVGSANGAAFTTASASDQFIANTASNTYPGYTFTGDLDTGFSAPTADRISVVQGGEVRGTFSPTGFASIRNSGGAASIDIVRADAMANAADVGTLRFYDGSLAAGRITTTLISNTAAHEFSTLGFEVLKDGTITTVGNFTTGSNESGNTVYFRSLGSIRVATTGNVALPSYTFFSDEDTGMYRGGANILDFAVNGAKVLELTTTTTDVTGIFTTSGNLTVDTTTFHVDSVGNYVGIGTTRPNTALDVTGVINATTNVRSPILYATTTLQVGDKDLAVALPLFGDGGTTSALYADDPVFIANKLGVSSNVYVANTDFHVDTTGHKVSIGKVRPNVALDVVGSINATSNITATGSANIGNSLEVVGRSKLFGNVNIGLAGAQRVLLVASDSSMNATQQIPSTEEIYQFEDNKIRGAATVIGRKVSAIPYLCSANVAGSNTAELYLAINSVTLDDTGPANLTSVYVDYNQLDHRITLPIANNKIQNAHIAYNALHLYGKNTYIPNAYGLTANITINDAFGSGTPLANIDIATGIYSTIQMDGGKIITSYLYRGDYGGLVTPNAKWGIHLTNETYNYFSGNIGVGITTPTTPLHVIGSGNITGGLVTAGTITADGNMKALGTMNAVSGFITQSTVTAATVAATTGTITNLTVVQNAVVDGKANVLGTLVVSEDSVTDSAAGNSRMRLVTGHGATSTGFQDIYTDMPGLQLVTGNLNNTTQKYMAPIVWLSNDASFNAGGFPVGRMLAYIAVRATQTYNDVNDGGATLEFGAQRANPGINSLPAIALTIAMNAANAALITTNGSFTADGTVTANLVSSNISANGGIITTTVYKTANQMLASTTTLTDDTQLQFQVEASKKYAFELKVWYNTLFGIDFKCDMTGPASPTRVQTLAKAAYPGQTMGQFNDMIRVYNGYPVNVNVEGLGANTAGYIRMEGIIHNGVNAGIVKFRWAPETSNANVTTVYSGSSIQVSEIN